MSGDDAHDDGHHGVEESADSAELNLTPREVPPASAVRRRRRWVPFALLAAVLAVGGALVVKFLSDSIDYYCNVDEVGRKDGCDRERRIRVQGEVVAGSLGQDGAVTTFQIAFNGASLPVRLDGDPGGVFKECIAVVVHGRVEAGADGDVFVGDRVETKHDDEYTEKNGERVEEGEADTCTEPTTSAS